MPVPRSVADRDGDRDESHGPVERVLRLKKVLDFYSGVPPGVLARALFAYGFDREAVEQFMEIIATEVPPHHGCNHTYLLPRVLFALGRYSDALDEYERKGRRRAELMEKIQREEPWRTISPEFAQNSTFLTKSECISAIISLRETLGPGCHVEEQLISSRYPYVHESSVRAFGNWKSAVAVLDKFRSLDEVRRLVEKLRPKNLTPFENLDSTPKPCSSRSKKKKSHTRFYITRDGAKATAGYGDTARRELTAGFYNADFRHVIDHAREGGIMEGSHDLFFNSLRFVGEELLPSDLRRFYRGLTKKRSEKDPLPTRSAWLEEHIAELDDHCARKMEAFRSQHGADILTWLALQNPGMLYSKEEILEKFVCAQYGVSSPDLMLEESPLRAYADRFLMFTEMPQSWPIIQGILCNAESEIRAQMGVPEVGEGWKSEAEMRHYLAEALHPIRVEAQASPPWLDGLRFDAYVPELRLAVEYHGRQHFEPVEFFGGEGAFRANQERDRRKAALSAMNGVTVEYIRYDESIRERVAEIVAPYMPRLFRRHGAGEPPGPVP